MVVEEIENEPFPDQASRILSLLREEAGNQSVTLVTTTHSPALLDAVRPEDHEDIVIVHRNEDSLSRLIPAHRARELPRAHANRTSRAGRRTRRADDHLPGPESGIAQETPGTSASRLPRRRMLLVDTSVLLEVLRVPFESDRSAEVAEEFDEHLRRGVALQIPMASVLETGSHIRRIRNGGSRRRCAKTFTLFLEQVLIERPPWRFSLHVERSRHTQHSRRRGIQILFNQGALGTVFLKSAISPSSRSGE